MDQLKMLLDKELRAAEGRRANVYDDATGQAINPGSNVKGHPTIGIGRALNKKGLSNEEIEYLFTNDLNDCIKDASTIPVFSLLNPARQMVLCCMCYQMGLGGVRGFTNTLRAMAEGRFADAAQGMLNSQWARQTPSRARRMAEIMRTRVV